MISIVESKRTMLVVDDDEGILRVFRRIFERKGYQVSTAKTGKDAEKMLAAHNYDVALVDLTLPDMSGDELLLRMKGKSPETVKIVITGLSHENALKVIEDGADAFLEKPVQPEFLINLLEDMLKRKM